MTVSETFVIVGAGLAGAKAAEALREQGFDGRVVLIGEEPHLPYERPPLSKGYLAGSSERDKVFVHPENWYSEHNVELQLRAGVTAIDRAAHRVVLENRQAVEYDKLLLTTGATWRTLPTPGIGADGVHHLRTLDDSDGLREVFTRSSRLAVVGAGWIGLEVTAAARQAGLEVSVVEAGALPLLRVLGPEVAQVFADLHRAHGVDFHFDAILEEITTADGRATGVKLGDGSVIEADAVLLAVGALPNTRLAEEAGLEVDNGILVDASLRTTDPDVFAAGDVANATHPFFGGRVRVEHWANALNQPATVASSMLDRDATYAELPYFFTDQYDLGMEYVGYVAPGGYDQVVFRGDVAAREFIAFWLSEGRVVAGMNVNVWEVTDSIKALIRSRASIDPDRLGDTEIKLADLI